MKYRIFNKVSFEPNRFEFFFHSNEIFSEKQQQEMKKYLDSLNSDKNNVRKAINKPIIKNGSKL